MKTHSLKLDRKYYEASKNGQKTFEIRKNDRDFRVGDILELREYYTSDDGTEHYTGRKHNAIITYILDDERYLKPGYVCLGLFF